MPPRSTSTFSAVNRAGVATPLRIAVVIPCFRVRRQILSVLQAIGPEVAAIYVVDDSCPEGSGRLVDEAGTDPRIRVIYHESNLGVGGATVSGYREAIADGVDVIVKLDGDGQMDPATIPQLVEPILAGYADYTKGNRFYEIDGVRPMPRARQAGNLVLSFLSKLSSGYWHLFDPTNGFTAIHASVANAMPLGKLAQRYFFESDVLFRLNILGAVVYDIPMSAHYGNESSGLRLIAAIPEFLAKHLANFCKRIVYLYFLRDFTMASIELVLGVVALVFGITFGALNWLKSISSGVTASPGTVMTAALPVIVGAQLLLAFLAFDTGRRETLPLNRRLGVFFRGSRGPLERTEDPPASCAPRSD